MEASNPGCFWKPEQGTVASDTNAQNFWCCCFKEIRKSFSVGRERTQAWEFKQRCKPKEEGGQEKRDFRLHELAQTNGYV